MHIKTSIPFEPTYYSQKNKQNYYIKLRRSFVESFNWILLDIESRWIMSHPAAISSAIYK